MATIALYILLAATAVTAVQVGFGHPEATSYIYRSDNNGPASYDQLGAPAPYHAVQNAYTVSHPIPAPQPIKAIEAYNVAAVPLPYIAAKPIAVEDAEDDDDESDESSEEYLDGGDDSTDVGHSDGNSFAKEGGSDYDEKHHSAQGEKGGKGHKSEDHHAKGESGKYGKEHHQGYYDEAAGGKKGHHDEASAHGKHYESGENYKGGDHGHKEHFSKGEDITGYHKVFHKDEFKKDHDFYDVAENSGHFNKHGSEEGHHGSEKSGHKKGGHHDSASKKGGFGKAGFHAKGHVDDSDHGHSAKEGHEKQYHDESEYGKKGASSHEKGYEFAEGDGDDYEEDHE